MLLGSSGGVLYQAAIEQYGFAICSSIVPRTHVADPIASLDLAGASPATYGMRNLLRRSPAIHAVAHSAEVKGLAEAVLGPDAFPVRAILFDKHPGANWRVGWHQDLTIAVKERIEIAGFDAWTTKDGVAHVRPPVAILEQMLTLRLHLDPADTNNGALVVIPGSHRQGRLSGAAIPTDRAVVCAAAAGDVLAFRPLLLHMSRKSASAHHRRVIQLEYAAAALPSPLAWYEQDER
jgi:ectoine hydroxylase-related dioxygenase (phytanoyl-CoA dioxygenase family)